MDRSTFIDNTFKLALASHNARIIAEAFGCDIDCEGFIGDLISGYGDLILMVAVNHSESLFDELVEDFWNELINKDTDVGTIAQFYDERIAK